MAPSSTSPSVSWDWLPVFVSEAGCKIIVDSLNYCHRHKGLRTNAYVLDYLHANPCRKGLVNQPEYWRFSSAGYWLSGGTIASEVLLTPIHW
jgi:hypothetical protein